MGLAATAAKAADGSYLDSRTWGEEWSCVLRSGSA